MVPALCEEDELHQIREQIMKMDDFEMNTAIEKARCHRLMPDFLQLCYAYYGFSKPYVFGHDEPVEDLAHWRWFLENQSAPSRPPSPPKQSPPAAPAVRSTPEQAAANGQGRRVTFAEPAVLVPPKTKNTNESKNATTSKLDIKINGPASEH